MSSPLPGVDPATPVPHPMHPRPVARWIKLTFWGWTLGFGFVLAFVALAGVLGLGDTQFPVGLGMGLGVGWLQAMAVEPILGGRRAWIAASALGVALPFVVFDIARLLGSEVPLSLVLNGVLGGALAGALQARLLAPHVRGAWRWIPVSVGGWSLAASTVLLNERFLPRIPGLAGAGLYVAVVLLGGLALGVVGGVALDRLLARPA